MQVEQRSRTLSIPIVPPDKSTSGQSSDSLDRVKIVIQMSLSQVNGTWIPAGREGTAEPLHGSLDRVIIRLSSAAFDRIADHASISTLNFAGADDDASNART